MKIRSIRVQSFKRFRQPLALEGLQDGLNLFTAPNEGGKSTVVEAIRAAFLERHRTTTLGHLLPWDEANGSPMVRIEFTVGGQPCAVAKSFLARKSCQVEIGGQAASGEDAELRLGELLGFSLAKKGASGAEHQGIPGLLWIRQGHSYNIADEVRHAGDYLRRALGDSMGELAASQGDRILRKVEEERNRLLTPEGGRPREAYAQAIAQERELAAQLEQLRQAVASYDAQVDHFARLREEHQRAEAAKPWLALRAQLEQVRAQLQALDLLAAERQREQAQAEACAAQLALIGQQLQKFQQDETALQARERQLAQAQDDEREALAAAQHHEQRREAAARADADAREASTRARQAQARSKVRADLADLAARRGALQAKLADVEQRAAQLGALQADAARHAVRASDVQQLRRLQQQCDALAARLEAVATRIEFDLVPGAEVTLEGEPLQGAAARTVLQPATLDIAGVGRLRVLPGATELATLLADRERLEAQRQALLAQLGVPHLQAAEERLRLAGERAAAIAQEEAVLQALAPQGADGLRQEIANLQGSEEREQAALALLPEMAGEIVPAAEAEAAEQRTRAELRAAEEALQAARQRAAAAQSQRAAAQAEVAAATERLRDPARASQIGRLQQQLLEQRTRQDAALQRCAQIAAQLQAANAPLLRQDETRLDASARQLEAAHRQRHEQLLQLGAELETQGALGLAESAAQKDRELAQVRRRLADLQQRAAALDHLLKLLRARRADVARRLRAPLQRHLNHYLQILFPGAAVEIDDDLMPARITRAGPNGSESGSFEALSLGTREQMGIIARLAYADLLRESGKPTHLILDDALVNSDADRLGQMKRVLFDAAQRHQILVFTCHPQGWQDLGVAPRPLQ